MNARDRLNLMHLGDDVIVAATEMMSQEEPTMMDLHMIAIDLETAARKIRMYANSIRRDGGF